MDYKAVEQALAHEMILGWDITPTGSGLLISTNWRLPNKDRIEIHVRAVGEREDLYLVTDGGALFNLLFLQGLDLPKDEEAVKSVADIVDNFGVKLMDGQMVKGASERDLGQAVRWMLEAVKEISFVLWGRMPKGDARLH